MFSALTERFDAAEVVTWRRYIPALSALARRNQLLWYGSPEQFEVPPPEPLYPPSE